MSEHRLKTWQEYYSAVERGEKTYEIRVNDRNFKEGDVLVLEEYDQHAKAYTGKSMRFRVGFMLQGCWGLGDGICCMSLLPEGAADKTMIPKSEYAKVVQWYTDAKTQLAEAREQLAAEQRRSAEQWREIEDLRRLLRGYYQAGEDEPVYQYIRARLDEGRYPTYAEIGRACYLAKGAVHKRVKRLQRKGLLPERWPCNQYGRKVETC